MIPRGPADAKNRNGLLRPSASNKFFHLCVSDRIINAVISRGNIMLGNVTNRLVLVINFGRSGRTDDLRHRIINPRSAPLVPRKKRDANRANF